MAYCLRSFVQILEEILHPDQHHKKWVLDHDKIPQVQSLWETASFLRDFLDNSSPLIQERIACLEDKIMNAAEKAEDTLETYLTIRLVSSREDQVPRIKAWKRQNRRNCCENSFSKIFKCIYPQGQSTPNLGDASPISPPSFGDAFTISPPNLEDAIQAFEDAKQEVIKFRDACEQQLDNEVPLPFSTTRYPSSSNVVVGVTDDLNRLRSRLTSRASELDIIPIVGMGGMGKTTLARILYDEFSSTSKSYFDCCAWVTVSQTYDPQLILKTLIACIPEKTQHDDNLVVSLYKTLYGRRYLIVLDDIWSGKAWDDVRMAFPQDNKGSRIILTTRETIVADYVNPKCHEMHLINKDDSWELLRGKIFGEESCPLVFEEVGRKIAISCGGLPLALQVIGGLLSQSQKSIDFWEHVANNVTSLIGKTDDQFSGIFSWSFSHLPHYLKPCFLYMASFPEDSDIPTSKLIKLWVSEGFLYPIRDKSLEEAAKIHLNALVDRNLIFVRERGKSGRAKSFGMHDLLRDLCLRKAQEKKFLYLKTSETDNHQENFGRIVGVGAVKNTPILTPLTRSFLCCNHREANTLSGVCFKLSLLRVLDLPHFHEFPREILHLVNLRYLHIAIWLCAPEDISVLRNLRTLITSSISSFAPLISDMPQLRHLKFSSMKEHSISPYDVHENLQKLSRVPAYEVRKLLGKLPNLRKLTIECYNDKEFVDMACFNNLEALKCFHGFSGDFGVSPNMTFPISLKKLSLWYCEISQSLLDAIGMLPNLHILIIKDSREKMDWEPCEDGFRELQYLKFDVWDLVNWFATEVHFPVLEHLVLQFCHSLIEIPNDFGAIETLKMIELDQFCLPSVTDSARRIYEEQCQFGNTGLQLRLV